MKFRFLAGPLARPSWRLAAFLLAAAAAIALAGPLAGIAFGVLGLRPGDAGAAWIFPLLLSTLLLGVTWAALRLGGGRLADLGLAPNRRRAVEFAAGFGAAAVVFGGVALVRAAAVGAGWSFDPGAGARAALASLPLVFLRLFPEELLFRGYAFRMLQAGWGATVALLLSSLLFGAYHVLGSGHWGMGAVYLFLLPALGGLVFGLAALRTGGLALPIGLHLGGNWVGASVLGLGMPVGGALWSAPVDAAQAAWLTSPDLLPRLPYLVGVLLLAVAVLAWTARPSREGPAA